MSLSASYLQLLIVAALAFALFLAALFHRPAGSRPTRLQSFLAKEQQQDAEVGQYLMPLLLYEELYPAFAEIMAVVVERFPLRDLLQLQAVQENLDLLSENSCREVPAAQTRFAMCQIVRSLLDNPEIEYRCRDQLAPLVDRFLDEINL